LRIGIFDSGIGGLTVLAAIRARLPGHDLLYLGDTARIPYGTRSPRTVVRYSLRVASHLYDQGIDAMVVACNTATTHALPHLERACAEVGIPVFGVVEPGVEAALAATRGGAVAVLGTPSTIAGAAYQKALAARAPDLEVHTVACPLFVPLVEEGWTSGDVPTLVARSYLEGLVGKVDVAVLGCTHYPLLRGVLGDILVGTTLVDSATATADAMARTLGEAPGNGSVSFMVTDHAARFVDVGARFFGAEPTPVTLVDVADAAGAFDRPPGSPG
jgi:glutamate racemase